MNDVRRCGRGISFVLSAPSGAGKTTLAERLLRRVPGITRTISCTTRAPRPDEVDGRDYFFLDAARFEAHRRAGEFLEWAEVHGNRYGTLRSQIEQILGRGDDALMVIDVQGAAAVRERLEGAVTIFVLPPSPGSLVQRLGKREGRDPVRSEVLRRRLGVALHEIEQYVGYDYVVVNDDLEDAAEELAAIVIAERCRCARRRSEAEAIRRAFAAAGENATISEAADEAGE